MRIIKWMFSFILVGISIQAIGQKGYDITVSFKQPIPKQEIYLAKYYAKPIPNQIYMVDTAEADASGKYHFKKKDTLIGGVYLIIFNNKTKWVEAIVDNGIKMQVTIDTTNLVHGTLFEGSKENSLNKEYQVAAEKFQKDVNKLKGDLAKASSSDSVKIHAELNKLNESFIARRRKFIQDNPNTFFATILKSIDRPVVPAGPHYLEDGKTIDSFYAFKYTKMHYWDNFDFSDDRLIHTPIYDGKLNDYLDNYIFPSADSLNHEIDFLAAKSKKSPELYKYTLHMLGNYTRSGKRMNLDESFIHLVENYYMQGEAYWLDSTQLHKYYIEPAQKMKPIVLGNVGPDFRALNLYDLTSKNLHDMDADYTIFVVWDITCGHCKEEIPRIDSIYKQHNLEHYNAKIFSLPFGESIESIQKVVAELGVNNPNWNHYIIPNGETDIRALYNFIPTPQVFMLDREKKLIAKMINHDGILKVIEYFQKDKK